MLHRKQRVPLIASQGANGRCAARLLETSTRTYLAAYLPPRVPWPSPPPFAGNQLRWCLAHGPQTDRDPWMGVLPLSSPTGVACWLMQALGDEPLLRLQVRRSRSFAVKATFVLQLQELDACLPIRTAGAIRPLQAAPTAAAADGASASGRADAPSAAHAGSSAAGSSSSDGSASIRGGDDGRHVPVSSSSSSSSSSSCSSPAMSILDRAARSLISHLRPERQALGLMLLRRYPPASSQADCAKLLAALSVLHLSGSSGAARSGDATGRSSSGASNHAAGGSSVTGEDQAAAPRMLGLESLGERCAACAGRLHRCMAMACITPSWLRVTQAMS